MFLNYPFVKQNDQKDCGVACLAMIIKHYKGYISPDILRDMTNTDRTGTTAYDLIKTANDIGFEAIGVKTDLNANQNIILPCIAHIVVDNKYNHYVVIYKIYYKKRKLLIADPATNIRYISFDEFNKVWTNVLLMMHPVKNIPTYKKHSIFKFILDIFILNLSLIKSMFMLSIIITMATIISSFFLQIFLSTINLNNPINRVIIISIIFIFIEIVKTISDFIRNKILIYLNQKIDLMLTMDTYKNILTLPYKYYRNHTTGEILSKIYDLSTVRIVISKISLTIFIDIILTFTSSIVLFLISYKLFIIILIIFITYLISIIIFSKTINNNIIKLQKEKANVSSYLVESINGFETIKGLNIIDNFITKFEQNYINLLEKVFKLDSLHNKQYLIKQLITNLSTIVINMIGILMVVDNQLTIGALLTFHMLFNYFLHPISTYTETYTNIKEAEHALNRILDLKINNESSGIIKAQITGDILIKNLNFNYNDDETFLNNINIKINKGEKVLITGASGSGKSTLLKIIKKYYKIERNMLFLNNIDINDFTDPSFEDSITYVSQNETLFTDTIINNIKLYRKVENDKLMKLIKIFRVDQIINSSLGYNALIEENGFNISGGERQRIILTRSFIDEKPIILIDEGFSQMDINLERIILKDLFKTYPYQTIIVTSHRLDNLDLFDHLFEINKGFIVKDTIING